MKRFALVVPITSLAALLGCASYPAPNQHLAESVAAIRGAKEVGVAVDRVTAPGVGPSQPIADNSSTEGRADDRRVEIVIRPNSRLAPSTTGH